MFTYIIYYVAGRFVFDFYVLLLQQFLPFRSFAVAFIIKSIHQKPKNENKNKQTLLTVKIFDSTVYTTHTHAYNMSA